MRLVEFQVIRYKPVHRIGSQPQERIRIAKILPLPCFIGLPLYEGEDKLVIYNAGCKLLFGRIR